MSKQSSKDNIRDNIIAAIAVLVPFSIFQFWVNDRFANWHLSFWGNTGILVFSILLAFIFLREWIASAYMNIQDAGIIDYSESLETKQKWEKDSLSASKKSYYYQGITGYWIWKFSKEIKEKEDSCLFLAHYEETKIFSELYYYKNVTDRTEADYIKEQQAAILETLETFMGCPNVKIKFYRKLNHCWLEIFDDRNMIYGILFPERSGTKAPAFLIAKEEENPKCYFKYLYDHYWQQLWDDPSSVDAIAWYDNWRKQNKNP